MIGIITDDHCYYQVQGYLGSSHIPDVCALTLPLAVLVYVYLLLVFVFFCICRKALATYQVYMCAHGLGWSSLAQPNIASTGQSVGQQPKGVRITHVRLVRPQSGPTQIST